MKTRVILATKLLLCTERIQGDVWIFFHHIDSFSASKGIYMIYGPGVSLVTETTYNPGIGSC